MNNSNKILGCLLGLNFLCCSPVFAMEDTESETQVQVDMTEQEEAREYLSGLVKEGKRLAAQAYKTQERFLEYYEGALACFEKVINYKDARNINFDAYCAACVDFVAPLKNESAEFSFFFSHEMYFECLRARQPNALRRGNLHYLDALRCLENVINDEQAKSAGKVEYFKALFLVAVIHLLAGEPYDFEETFRCLRLIHDDSRAREYFQVFPATCILLGSFCLRGKDKLEKNFAKARVYFEEVIMYRLNGMPLDYDIFVLPALCALSEIYALGGTGVFQDIRMAKFYAQKVLAECEYKAPEIFDLHTVYQLEHIVSSMKVKRD